MLFFYTVRNYVLAEKEIVAPLKNQTTPEAYQLQIITNGIQFLGLPMGGGLVKLSRLYTQEGKLIHARKYSPEIKQQVKALKAECKIPYLKLWKGYLILVVGILIAAGIFHVYHRNYQNNKALQVTHLKEQFKQLKKGQLFAVSNFIDIHEAPTGLSYGWIRVQDIVGDTLVIQRSKKVDVEHLAVFDVHELEAIKPSSEADWEQKVEKMNLALVHEQLEDEQKQTIDLQYIDVIQNQYRGVVFSVKAAD